VLLDVFANSHGPGGLEFCVSPSLDLVVDRDAPESALESYLAIPANAGDGEVSIENLLDDALARIGAEVERRENQLTIFLQVAFEEVPATATE
jgi:hypothetical protein